MFEFLFDLFLGLFLLILQGNQIQDMNQIQMPVKFAKIRYHFRLLYHWCRVRASSENRHRLFPVSGVRTNVFHGMNELSGESMMMCYAWYSYETIITDPSFFGTRF
ncbi:hypothetical protein JOM56_013626 [Amanita muscaria]